MLCGALLHSVWVAPAFGDWDYESLTFGPRARRRLKIKNLVPSCALSYRILKIFWLIIIRLIYPAHPKFESFARWCWVLNPRRSKQKTISDSTLFAGGQDAQMPQDDSWQVFKDVQDNTTNNGGQRFWIVFGVLIDWLSFQQPRNKEWIKMVDVMRSKAQHSM